MSHVLTRIFIAHEQRRMIRVDLDKRLPGCTPMSTLPCRLTPQPIPNDGPLAARQPRQSRSSHSLQSLWMRKLGEHIRSTSNQSSEACELAQYPTTIAHTTTHTHTHTHTSNQSSKPCAVAQYSEQTHSTSTSQQSSEPRQVAEYPRQRLRVATRCKSCAGTLNVESRNESSGLCTRIIHKKGLFVTRRALEIEWV